MATPNFILRDNTSHVDCKHQPLQASAATIIITIDVILLISKENFMLTSKQIISLCNFTMKLEV